MSGRFCAYFDGLQGFIEWDDFCSHLMQDLGDKYGIEHDLSAPVLVCAHTFENPHRDLIIRVTTLHSPTRLLTASQDGVIVTWSMKMHQQRYGNRLSFCVDVNSVVRLKSLDYMKQVQVTDIAIMPNAYRMAVATNNRDLSFYETATGQLYNRLVGLTDAIQRLHYHVVDTNTGILFCGDMNGQIMGLKFLNCSKGLFESPGFNAKDNYSIHFKTLRTLNSLEVMKFKVGLVLMLAEFTFPGSHCHI